MEKRNIHHPTKIRNRTDPLISEDGELSCWLKSDVSADAITAITNERMAKVVKKRGWLNRFCSRKLYQCPSFCSLASSDDLPATNICWILKHIVIFFLFVTRFNQAIERVVVSDDNRRVEKWIRWAEIQYTSPFKVEYECNDTLRPNHQALKFRFNTARIPLRLHGILLRPEILLYKDGSCPTLFLSFGYKNKTEVIQPSIPTGTICLLFNCPTSVSEHWQEESGKPHHLLLDAHRLR